MGVGFVSFLCFLWFKVGVEVECWDAGKFLKTSSLSSDDAVSFCQVERHSSKAILTKFCRSERFRHAIISEIGGKVVFFESCTAL